MKRYRAVLGFAAIIPLLAQVHADTFTVNTTNDTGPGSLRQVILDANATPGADTIEFNVAIPAPLAATIDVEPPQVRIEVMFALPTVTDPLAIRGFTQPGSSANTSSNGNNARVMIELNGAGAGTNTDGLVFASGAAGSTVEGLWIRQFGGNGLVANNATLTVSGSYLTECGLNGLAALSSTVTIGGNSTSNRTVISGNCSNGVLFARLPLLGAAFGDIRGSFIGTGLTGTNDWANKLHGVCLDNGTALIGEVAPGAFNIISGNCSNGIHVTGGDARLTARGNFIGTDVTCLQAIPNKGHGIFVDAGVLSVVDDNDIGFNFKNGITVTGTADFYRLNNNRIFGHVFCGLAVDATDSGVTSNDFPDADGIVNFPIITSVITNPTGTSILGTFQGQPNTVHGIEVYANTECNHHGHGEAEALVAGATAFTDPNGNATWSAGFVGAPPAPIFTAQATRFGTLPPESSEMGPCFDIDPTRTILTITMSDTADPVPAGGPLQYQIDVGNTIRPLDATGLVMDFVGPEGFTTTGAAGDGWSCSVSNGTTRCTRDTLPAGTNAPQIVIDGTAPGVPGLATANACILAGNALEAIVGHHTTVTGGMFNLVIEKTTDKESVVLGESLNYTIVVSNASPNEVNAVSVRDLFPPDRGGAFVSGGGGWSIDDLQPEFFFARLTTPLPGNSAAPPIHVLMSSPEQPAIWTNIAQVTVGELGFDPPLAEDMVITPVVSVPVRTCTLTPSVATNQVRTSHSVTTTVLLGGAPLDGTDVMFNVISGPNAGPLRSGVTDTNGQAIVTYLGGGTPGTDIIQASGDGFSCTATKVWVLQLGSACDLTPNSVTNPVNGTQMFAARVTNNDLPAEGVGISFEVTEGPDVGQGGTAMTDAEGMATFTLTNDGTPGTDLLIASGQIDGQTFTCTGEGTWELPVVTADLGVSKSFSPNPVIINQSVIITIVVTNHGPDTATGVQIDEQLPGNLATGGIPTNCMDIGSALRCPLPDLPPNTSVTFTLASGGFAIGTATNIVTVSANTLDPNPANNQDTNLVTVIPVPQVACSLTPSVATNQVQTAHSVTATVLQDGEPLVGVGVEFAVISGPNPAAMLVTNTDAAGQATFRYSGGGTPGTDIIQASGDGFSCTATKVWVTGELGCTLCPQPPGGDGNRQPRAALNLLNADGPACPELTNTVGGAQIIGLVLTTPDGAPVAGITVTFQVIEGPASNLTVTAVTATNGVAGFELKNDGTPGTDVVQATVPGSTCNLARVAWVLPVPPLSCTIEPATDTNRVGTVHAVTVTVRRNGAPEPAAKVTVKVDGVNFTTAGSGDTDANGEFTANYKGLGSGSDTITATVETTDGMTTTCTATKFWRDPIEEIDALIDAIKSDQTIATEKKRRLLALSQAARNTASDVREGRVGEQQGLNTTQLQLLAFIQQVETWKKTGQLTAAQADPLIQMANTALEALRIP